MRTTTTNTIATQRNASEEEESKESSEEELDYRFSVTYIEELTLKQRDVFSRKNLRTSIVQFIKN